MEASPDAGHRALACEFLRTYAGQDTQFAGSLPEISEPGWEKQVSSYLVAFAEYVEAGLYRGVSPIRAAQTDVVFGLLDQARNLLQDDKTHPAIVTVLIGAAVEEFLRTWMEAAGETRAGRPAEISAYSDVLHGNDLITDRYHEQVAGWAELRASVVAMVPRRRAPGAGRSS